MGYGEERSSEGMSIDEDFFVLMGIYYDFLGFVYLRGRGTGFR